MEGWDGMGDSLLQRFFLAQLQHFFWCVCLAQLQHLFISVFFAQLALVIFVSVFVWWTEVVFLFFGRMCGFRMGQCFVGGLSDEDMWHVIQRVVKLLSNVKHIVIWGGLPMNHVDLSCFCCEVASSKQYNTLMM
jgi:hypothetical protein